MDYCNNHRQYPSIFTRRTVKQLTPFLIVLICLAGSSCNTPQIIEEDRTVYINPNNSPVPIVASEILKEMELVKLETNPACIIGHFSSLIFMNDEFIVYRNGKTLLFFDNKGLYLSKIDAIGRGPGEYSTIVNAAIEPEKKLAYIFDYNSVKVYDFQGKYLKTIINDMPLGGGYLRENGQIVLVHSQHYSQENREMLSLFDEHSLQITHSFKSRNSDDCSDVTQNLFFTGEPYEVDDRLFYFEPFTKTIQEISDTILIPYWNIDLGVYAFETKDGINSSNRKKASRNKIPPIGLQETNKYFFIDFRHNKSRYKSLYDKELCEFIFHKKFSKNDFKENTVPILGFDNDLIENAPPFWPYYINAENAVCVINPSSLSKEQLLAFDCNENDNPILFIGKLR